MTELLVPISPGELIDKITILEIKSQRMTDPVKLANVRTELSLLARILDRADHEPAPAAPAIDDPFNPAFTSKAGVSVKAPSKDVWHAAMS